MPTDDMLTADVIQVPAPAPAEPPTAEQRLRICVPHLKTAVTLGQGASDGQLYADDPTDVLHFPGFGVTTRGHLHLEARGPRESSRVKLQANGEISLHSNQSGMNLGAKQGLALGTDGPGSLVAKSGVMIAGGWLGLGTVENGLQNPERSQSPATPEWVGDFKNVTGLLAKLFALMDGFVARHDEFVSQLRGDNELLEIDANEQDKERKEQLDKAKRRLKWYSAATSTLGNAYETWTALGNEPGETLNALNQALAGTTIIGQGGVTLLSPSTTSITSLLGVNVFSPSGVTLDGRELVELNSGRCISINAGKSLEAFAEKRNIQVANEVAVLGSNRRVTISAGDELLVKTPGHESYYFGGGVFETMQGERSTIADSQLITGVDKTVIDGKNQLHLVSSGGSVFVNAQDGVAAIGGSTAAAVHCEDAWLWAEPGKISLTVDADVAASNIDPAEHFDAQLDALDHKWSTARENEDHDKMVELERQRAKLEEARASAASDYADKVSGHSPNADNGIEITSSDVVIAVGGDKLSMKQGKVEILSSLKIT